MKLNQRVLVKSTGSVGTIKEIKEKKSTIEGHIYFICFGRGNLCYWYDEDDLETFPAPHKEVTL